ncbi:hypothetical protein [Nakamurella lactea]|uniref:hypothetical protein n=1 Tax=Nakamurella lactea TaxID=459515 RepID=UPI0004207EC8|nr:hypothetical protein [Nakamurella lactea]
MFSRRRLSARALRNRRPVVRSATRWTAGLARASALTALTALTLLTANGCTLADHGTTPPTVEGGGATADELNAAKNAVTAAGVAAAQSIRSNTVDLVKAEGQWARCGNGSNDPEAVYTARAVFLRKADKDTPLQKVDPVAAALVTKGWKITDNVSDADLGDVYLANGDLTAEVLTHGIQQVTVTVSSKCLVSNLVGSEPFRIGVDTNQINVP